MHARDLTHPAFRPTWHRRCNPALSAGIAVGLILAAPAVSARAAPPKARTADQDQRYVLRQIAELLSKLLNSPRVPARPGLGNRLTPAQPDSAYIQGLRDGYAAGLLDAADEARKQRLLRNRGEALRAGLLAFRNGRYDRAADLFSLACELDHGDPASRLHAAQALFALGQYKEAIRKIRRAFELQPKLIYLKFDLRRDYGNPKDFAEQLARFRRVLAERPNWAAGYLLLGYQLLYSGQRGPAHEAFRKAAALHPADELVRKMLRASIPLPSKKPGKSGQKSPTTRPALNTAAKA